MTAEQIDHAEKAGFAALRLDVTRLIDTAQVDAESNTARAVQDAADYRDAVRELRGGRWRSELAGKRSEEPFQV